MPSTKITKTVNYMLRVLIIVATYSFLYRKLLVERDLAETWDYLKDNLTQSGFLLRLAGVFLLMPVNWGLEAAKWQSLIERVERISWIKSFQAVLTGISVSSFTPNRTGEYFGRVFMLDKTNHIEGILITIIGSFAQLVVTLSLGLFCSLYYIPNFVSIPAEIYSYVYFGMVVLVPILIFLIVLSFFNVSVLTPILKRLLPRKWKKWGGYFEVFEKYPKKVLLEVFLMSISRYIVFSIQFYWLLWIFGIKMPLVPGLMVISVIYLVMTIIPTIALAELGVRGSVSILLISRYLESNGIAPADPVPAIFSASSVIWLINLIIPAVLGTFFVFRLKFIRR